jgi:hypothetical protein
MTDALEAQAYEVSDALLAKYRAAEPRDLIALAYLQGSRDGTQETIDRIDAIQVAIERLA